MNEPTCKACHGSWPKEDHFIADLGLSKAYLHEDQFFLGWTVIVFKRHATELFHLAPTERIQLMEEVNLVVKTLAQIYDAKKMNYELLGACPSNRKIPVLGGLFTLDRTEIVKPEPIVCVENFHL